MNNRRYPSPRSSLALALIVCVGACQRGPAEPPSGSRPESPSSAQRPANGAPANPHTTAPANDPHAGLGLPPPSGNSGPPLANPAAGGGDAVTQLEWDDPPGWRREQPASPMRRAQYKVTKVGADAADAEVTVITFGGGQGGSNEANIQRWLGQLEQPDGRQTSDVAQRRSLTVAGMNVLVVEAPGRIRGGSMMPGMAAAPAFDRGRLLAAIVETPNGPWFFKLTGGDETVTSARSAFETMLRSIRRR
ncbi:MAG: hypothetical protein JNK05_37475 [Myxococcales bacterium]|nr:hypothetical protein [Myxococcales bacterium]